MKSALYQIRLIRYRSVTNQQGRSYPRSGGRYRPLEGDAFFADRKGGVCSRIQKDNLWGFWFCKLPF
ncbi:MAG: hypothetical protein KatS3mg073_0976 [Meiothermus sp.]|uniref:Uncharacterized protein n=1 Tax=Meiothermus hypogaeus TaxID=884155 RepID=A0ABX9MJH0_9DEIN|nr:hypothetical protein Mhypo_02614 [Meiothermus hypogaeus]GIW36831.1 MAG: hypothetical protein KatS3mg073_0976 [Meiothermus sp.]